MSVRIRSRQTRGFVPIFKADLEALESVGSDLIFARSAFLTISAAANDEREDSAELSYAELARRSGMSRRKLHDAVKVLVEAKLLEVESGQKSGQPNVWTLLGGSAPGAEGVGTTCRGGRHTVPTPMETNEEEKKEEELSSEELLVDERVPKTKAWFARRSQEQTGEPARMTKAWDEAARKLVEKDPNEVSTILTWAWTKGDYWYSQTSTLPLLAKNWARARGAWKADQAREHARPRRRDEVPERGPAPRVTYDGGRVNIS